jgi:predicted NBD/HSP70 family sugar kinase
MLTGTNLQYAKSYNIRIVLETIRLRGPVSRIEIAKSSKLTAQTVTNITRELISQGYIIETKKIKDGRGAPSILLDINKDSAFSIGLDLDKDHLSGVLVDLMGNVRQTVDIELNFPTADEAMLVFEEMTNRLIDSENVSKDKIWGVGVSLPGPIDIQKDNAVTQVVNPNLMPGWQNVAVADILGKRLNLPVYLENNASAAALGERWFGNGQKYNTFFYVYFGAGLGGGLVINEQLHTGFSGNAAEVGYFHSNKAPFENSVSEKSHLGLFFNLPMLYKHLENNGYKASKTGDLLTLFETGCEPLQKWIENGAKELAPSILTIDYIIDPEVFFFGGRLPEKIIEELLLLISQQISDLDVRQVSKCPKLKIATAGTYAAALGVAVIPLQTQMSPIHKTLMKGNTDLKDSLAML